RTRIRPTLGRSCGGPPDERIDIRRCRGRAWAHRRSSIDRTLMSSGPSTVTAQDAGPAVHLSTTDKYLPVWIGAAMVTGLLLGRLVPGLDSWLGAVEIDGISLPIALGLLVMMYPVLAKVRYDRLDTVVADRRLLVSSL